MKCSSLQLYHFIDRTDVRVVQGGGDDFSSETFHRLRVPGEFLGQELEGNEASQLEVFRLVYDPHAATAQSFYTIR